MALLPGPLQAQENAPVLRTFKASRLLGMTVQNLDGQNLGTLRNFALDLRGGNVQYAIVASGGFIGMGTKLRAVPPRLMSAGTAKRDTLAINVLSARWKNAPAFKPSELASLGRPDRERQIESFYEQAPPEIRIAGKTDGPDTSMRLTPTGRESNPQVDRPIQLSLASDLIGATVVDRDHEKLGEVLDLLVTFDERRPVFVVFSGGKLSRDHKHDYAVPLRALQMTSKGHVMINADRKLFSQAPPLDWQAWKTAAGNEPPQVYRYVK